MREPAGRKRGAPTKKNEKQRKGLWKRTKFVSFPPLGDPGLNGIQILFGQIADMPQYRGCLSWDGTTGVERTEGCNEVLEKRGGRKNRNKEMKEENLRLCKGREIQEGWDAWEPGCGEHTQTNVNFSRSAGIIFCFSSSRQQRQKQQIRPEIWEKQRHTKQSSTNTRATGSPGDSEEKRAAFKPQQHYSAQFIETVGFSLNAQIQLMWWNRCR